MLFVSHQELAQGRTLDQIAAEHQASYTDTDRELIISQAFLDGRQAIQIEGEGEMAKSLQTITLYDDRVYIISVAPYGEFPKAAEDVALVWDLVLNSFTFIRPPVIQEEGQVEGDLHKNVQMDIKRMTDIGCYRGLRHRRNLIGP